MKKAPEAFRTISEVADLLETPAHVLRFWESKFYQIRPVKRAGGRRYYRPDDVALISGIKHLLQVRGMTIRGVQKVLQEQGIKHVMKLAPPQALFDDEPEAPSQPTEHADDDLPGARTASAVDAPPTPLDERATGSPDAADDATADVGSAALSGSPPRPVRAHGARSAVPPPRFDAAAALTPGAKSEGAADPEIPGPATAEPATPDTAEPDTSSSDAGPPETESAAAVLRGGAPVEAPDTGAADLFAPDAAAQTAPGREARKGRVVTDALPLAAQGAEERLAQILRRLPNGTLDDRAGQLSLLARRIDALLDRMSESSGAGRW